ncbi:MAG: hypothetical protein JSV23_05340 [Promethearchaeota archaeon]|nr:MAG: hypothetical protein JSV23_05340 [Candidatus Lokiarchaeota archaeon]
MQIFELAELSEFPYMETREVVQGQFVGDILNENSLEKVFILIDHDTNRIWTYNGPKCPLKTQAFGAILANKFRQQLRLFYRIYPLNRYLKEDKEFQELLEKQIGGGKAKPIEKKDFPEPKPDKYGENISVSTPRINKALEYVNELPKPQIDNLIRRFLIVGADIYTDEEITETFLKDEKNIIKSIKLGRLNNGFTFFQDHNYSTRLIIKEREIQGIELFIHEDDKSPSLKIEIPIIQEEKFSKAGSINSLIKAFQIPKKLQEEEKEEEGKEEEENQTDIQDDSTN